MHSPKFTFKKRFESNQSGRSKHDRLSVFYCLAKVLKLPSEIVKTVFVKIQVSIGKISCSLSVKNKSETGSSSSRVTLVVKSLRFLTVFCNETKSPSYTMLDRQNFGRVWMAKDMVPVLEP